MLLAWSLMAGIVVLWLLGWASWPRAWPTPVNFYLTALLLFAGSVGIMTYAAARRIGIERREGSLELILTTPLAPRQILEGQLTALRAQFRPVRFALLGLCGLMMAGGLLTRSWTVRTMISYCLIWFWFAVWSLFIIPTENATKAMWVALNTGRPTFAVFHRPRSGAWWWIGMAINLQNCWYGLTRAGSFPSGSTVELIVVSLVSFWFLTIGSSMAWVARAAGQNSWGGLTSRFVNELRLIAREPLPDPKDPRFKKWNVNESMPMSAYVKSYPERKQPEWGQRLGGLAGRQLGRGWARWQRRGKS